MFTVTIQLQTKTIKGTVCRKRAGVFLIVVKLLAPFLQMVGAARLQMLLKAPRAKLVLNFLIFSKHTFLSPRARHDVRRQARKRRRRWLECIPKRQDTHPVLQMAVSNTVLLQPRKKLEPPK